MLGDVNIRTMSKLPVLLVRKRSSLKALDLGPFLTTITEISKSESLSDVGLIKDVVRPRIEATNDCKSLVEIYSRVPNMPVECQLEFASEILAKLIDSAEGLSSNETIQILRVCAKLNAFDSDLFEKISHQIHYI